MYLHPNDYLTMLDQERERQMARNALERAARSGGEGRPGLARGGISGLARVLRGAASAIAHARTGTTGQTGQPTGSSIA